MATRLRDGRRATILTITIDDDLFTDYRRRSDFIRHYVFPGGMLPSIQRFQGEAGKAGLKTKEAFSFDLDCTQTLRAWSARMIQKQDAIKTLGHDQKFLRNWQFYLGMYAVAFAVKRTDVAQVELVRG